MDISATIGDSRKWFLTLHLLGYGSHDSEPVLSLMFEKVAAYTYPSSLLDCEGGIVGSGSSKAREFPFLVLVCRAFFPEEAAIFFDALLLGAMSLRMKQRLCLVFGGRRTVSRLLIRA